jgi:hypothetical protein
MWIQLRIDGPQKQDREKKRRIESKADALKPLSEEFE